MFKFNNFKIESETRAAAVVWLGLACADVTPMDLFCFERVLSRFIPALIDFKPVLFIVLPESG